MPGTYLITGIGRGIGAELARILMARGDRVVGTVRDAARALLDRILRRGGQLKLISLDLLDGKTVAAAGAALDDAVDVLINNAGVIGPSRQSALDMDFDGFAETLMVNTLGPLRVAQAFLPHLRRARSARIITISSRMGSLSSAKSDRIAYRVSKAAVNKLVQGLATDLESEGIITVAVHPGWVQTDMGGASADISTSHSATGILALIDRLRTADNGRFLNYDGTVLDF